LISILLLLRFIGILCNADLMKILNTWVIRYLRFFDEWNFLLKVVIITVTLFIFTHIWNDWRHLVYDLYLNLFLLFHLVSRIFSLLIIFLNLFQYFTLILYCCFSFLLFRFSYDLKLFDLTFNWEFWRSLSVLHISFSWSELY
jgi:hypothetical protein